MSVLIRSFSEQEPGEAFRYLLSVAARFQARYKNLRKVESRKSGDSVPGQIDCIQLNMGKGKQQIGIQWHS